MRTILDVVNKIAPLVQEEASKTGQNINDLLAENLKKECLGVDQNNQSTNEITFNDILTSSIDFDNEEICKIKTLKGITSIEDI